MSEEIHTPKPPKALWPVFVWAFVALAAFLIGTKALTSLSAPAEREDAARSAERIKAYETLQAENSAKLTTLAWADKAKGTVQLPIDMAMRLTADRLSRESPRAVPTATPEPLPAAPAAEPPPAAATEDTSAQQAPAPTAPAGPSTPTPTN